MRSDQFTIIARYLCSEMGLGLIRTRLSHDNFVLFRSNLKKPKNCRGGGWSCKQEPPLFVRNYYLLHVALK